MEFLKYILSLVEKSLNYLKYSEIKLEINFS